MRELLRSDAVVALPAMFAGQLIITMAAFALPVVAPAAMPAMGMATVYVGVFTASIYLVAMCAGLFSAPLLSRFGPVRSMQFLLLAVVAGALVFDIGHPVSAVLGAMLIGYGSGPMNPIGSYILARTTPPRWRAFVFSIKQVGTPAGSMLAGLIVPAVLLWEGWRAAVATLAVLALGAIVLIQPARRLLDTERPARRTTSLAAAIEPLRMVLRSRELRALALTGYLFGGCQVTFTAYLVVYLMERNGLSISAAGALFALFGACAIPVRVFWGALADRALSTRAILVLCGVLTSAGLAMTAMFSAAWPLWALVLVVVLLGCTANGWAGLFLAEIARIVAADHVSDASGGCQFFFYGGIMSMPLAFGAFVAASGSYAAGYGMLTALPLVAVALLVATATPRRVQSGGPSS